MSVTRSSVLMDVVRERMSQDDKWGEQNHDPTVWSSILGEEMGEACEQVNRVHFGMCDDDLLEDELIQVAAVAVAWVESIRRAREAS